MLHRYKTVWLVLLFTVFNLVLFQNCGKVPKNYESYDSSASEEVTMPSTSEDEVALEEKLGANLLKNGDFTIATGWQNIANSSVVSGFTRVGKSAGGIKQAVAAVAGLKYQVTADTWLSSTTEPGLLKIEFKNASGIVVAKTAAAISTTTSTKRQFSIIAPANTVSAEVSIVKEKGSSHYVYADNVSLAVVMPDGPLPIIPKGVGFGMETPAGSGRHLNPPATTVYKVTHLKATGPGSFQECVYAKGPRVCVFEVSGTIDLTGDKFNNNDKISIENPYLTIAGQTAPSPGITIKGKTLRIEAHNVLIQHIRVRVGDSTLGGSDFENRDGIVVIGSPSKPESERPHNIVIDHVTASWGIDETFTVKDTAKNVTLTNNMVYEGLRYSLHPKGPHSKGMMISGNYMTVAGNLISSVDDRAPLETSPNAIVVNTLTYNVNPKIGMQMAALDNNAAYKGFVRSNTVARNVRIPGPDVTNTAYQQWMTITENRSNSRIYAEENICGAYQNSAWPCVSYGSADSANIVGMRESKMPIWNTGLRYLPVAQVKDYVLKNAGARPLDRDSADKRIVAEIQNGKIGRVPNCVENKTQYYPVGKVLKSTNTTVDIPMVYCQTNGTLKNRQIEITSGKGAGQVRTFTAQSCGTGLARGTINMPWVTLPDATSVFRVKQDCSVNVGGWPTLVSQVRKLTIPANPNQIMPSGYTRLEEYLHTFYKAVEPAQ